MPILYRSDKGGPLTYQEVDDNFRDLDQRLKALEMNPSEGEGISSVSVEGDQMRLQGTRGQCFGPFTLPKVFWKARGAWKPYTSYAPLEVVFYQNKLFCTVVPHVSEEAFPEDVQIFWQEMFCFQELNNAEVKL